MPDRIRWNIKHLTLSLEVSLFLEDLLEEDVLEIEEYEAVAEKESNRSEAAKGVVRYLLKKRTEQVDKFLQIVKIYQPAVVEHVWETMRRRAEGTVQQSTSNDRAAASSAGSSSKKATSTSGSEPVKPAAAKPTPDAKKPVAESQPVSSSDTVVERRSIDSGKNLPSDLGICPKCAVGELTLRKDVGGTCCKIGCSNFDGGCKGFITFPDFVTDVSPARRNCGKCGKMRVELKFKRGKAPEEMKQGYKGCINGDCDPVMQRNRWTIPKSVGDDGSTGKPMGSAMGLTGNEGATSPGTQLAVSSSGTMVSPNPSWPCDCGMPAIRLQTKKECANRGRWFHKCATEKCKFWKWEDEHLSDLRTPSAASNSARLPSGSGSVNASGPGLKRSREEMNGGGGDGDSTPKRKLPTRTCSECKKPGHTKRKCPERSAQ